MKVETEKTKVEHKWLKKCILIFVTIIILISSGLLYSRYIGTAGLNIKEYKITNSKLPNNFHGLKIVHISDLHYGRITFEKELKQLVNKVNMLKPDIIVFTGDLIDKDTNLDGEASEIISNYLNQMNASIGKYAIEGNHDYNFENWEIIIENGGFTNLNESYDTIYNEKNECILISGMSTNLYGETTISEKLETTKTFISSLEESKKPNYRILLIHEPDYVTDVESNTFDLILAGHSHNGQVKLPGIGAIILPPGAKKYYKEHYTIENTELYISSGVGVSTVNFRLFNHPSFNLYRLTNY